MLLASAQCARVTSPSLETNLYFAFCRLPLYTLTHTQPKKTRLRIYAHLAALRSCSTPLGAPATKAMAAREGPSSPLDILVDVAVAYGRHDAPISPLTHPCTTSYNDSAPRSLPSSLTLASSVHNSNHVSLPQSARSAPPLPPHLIRTESAPTLQEHCVPVTQHVVMSPVIPMGIAYAPPPPTPAMPIPVQQTMHSVRPGSAPAAYSLYMPLKKGTRGRRDSYTRFTPEEEAMLLDGVRVHGVGNWKKILVSYRFHWKRTAVDLKDKYRNITRAKMRKLNAAAAHSNSNSDVSSIGSETDAIPIASHTVGSPIALSPICSQPVIQTDSIDARSVIPAQRHLGA